MESTFGGREFSSNVWVVSALVRALLLGSWGALGASGYLGGTCAVALLGEGGVVKRGEQINLTLGVKGGADQRRGETGI